MRLPSPQQRHRSRGSAFFGFFALFSTMRSATLRLPFGVLVSLPGNGSFKARDFQLKGFCVVALKRVDTIGEFLELVMQLSILLLEQARDVTKPRDVFDLGEIQWFRLFCHKRTRTH